MDRASANARPIVECSKAAEVTTAMKVRVARPDFDLLTLRVRKAGWLARRRQFWPLLRRGVAPSIEHDDLFSGRQFTTIVDIGSNLGQFAVWSAEFLSAKHIVCIEPLPDSQAQLRAIAAFLAPCKVDVFNVAFGSSRERKTLHITAASDSSSLLPPASNTQNGALKEIGAHVVEVCVGDDVLAGPYEGPLLVKIDVQGAELDVLQGMPRTLGLADAVLVEVSFAQLYEGQADPSTVVAHLLGAGLTLTGIARVPGSRQPWGLEQADLLFERR